MFNGTTIKKHSDYSGLQIKHYFNLKEFFFGKWVIFIVEH